MAIWRIPLELDLGSVPATAGEAVVEADLALVLQHAGANPATGPFTLRAQWPDGSFRPAQYLEALGMEAGKVILALPPAGAWRGPTTVALQVAAGAPTAPRVTLRDDGRSLEVAIDGARFALYRYDTTDPDLPRPYFHPVIGPTGVPITQEGEIPGQKIAHFHHTGLFLAHQNFTDGNNWQIGPNFSRMRHRGFDAVESGALRGRFVQRLEWLDFRGERVVFREVRTVSVPAAEPGRRFLEIDTLITCGDRPATWNATPYHLLAIRVPDAMTVARGGRITNSEGQVNPPGGTRARWLDFSGPLGDAVCGVAIFDHPENLRHPTPWLNFENETVGAAPTYREPYAWQSGETRRFRYRVYLHRGDVQEGDVARQYEAYLAAPRSRIGPPLRIA